MRPEILLVLVPIVIALAYAKRRRPAVRNDAAEVLQMQASAAFGPDWRGGESNPHLRIANASSSH